MSYANVAKLFCRSREEIPGPNLQEPVGKKTVAKTTNSKGSKVMESMVNDISNSLKRQPTYRAGALNRHLPKWKTLTSDSQILDIVKGFKFEFETVPAKNKMPKQVLTNAVEIQAAESLLSEFLKKQIIEEVRPHPDGYMSNIFLREKRDGSYRLILNLKPFNKYVKYRHFKMATLSTALDLISPNCYMASLDLSDAYYTVNVAPSQRKYLQFSFQGKTYQYTCMANGISSAPRTFTKLLKIPLSYLREKHHIIITAYLDDLLLIASSPEDLLKAVDTTRSLLTSLGFTISIKKSSIRPSSRVQFLGFILDSTDMLVTLGLDKTTDIKDFVTEALTFRTMTIRKFACLLGKLAATLPANRYGQVFLKRLETAKAIALKDSSYSYEGVLSLTKDIKQDLSWWLANIHRINRPIHPSNPDISLFTDASFEGWGCHIPSTGLKTGGRWSVWEQNFDINYLELTAVLLSLQATCANTRNAHILINSDNTTTVVSINRQGSTHSVNCNSVARAIWSWALKNSNWLSATHCPGVSNVEADEASRLFNDSTEWTLRKDVFGKICQRFGQPSIDLFASRLNHQVMPYCAWQPDPNALLIDCFTTDWSQFKLNFAFPPFSVVGQALRKIRMDGAQAIVVVPHWTTQPWFTQLENMMTEPPMTIKVLNNTLSLAHDPSRSHPLASKLRLLACRVA